MKVKKNVEVPEELHKLGAEIFEDYGDSPDDGIWFSQSEKFYEDDVMEFLNKMIPYIESGKLELMNEYNAYFRYIFRNGEWVEEDGEVVYGKPKIKLIMWDGTTRTCRILEPATLSDNKIVVDECETLDTKDIMKIIVEV